MSERFTAHSKLQFHPAVTLFLGSGVVAVVLAVANVVWLAQIFGRGRLRELSLFWVICRVFAQSSVDLCGSLPGIVHRSFDLAALFPFLTFLPLAVITNVVLTWLLAALVVPMVMLTARMSVRSLERGFVRWSWQRAYPLAVLVGFSLPSVFRLIYHAAGFFDIEYSTRQVVAVIVTLGMGAAAWVGLLVVLRSSEGIRSFFRICLFSGGLVAIVSLAGVGIAVPLRLATGLAPRDATITLDASQTRQVMNGWEAMDWIATFDTRYQLENVHKWKDEVAELAVNSVGINRVRLSIWSGTENPIDYFTRYRKDEITRNEWKTHWYEIVNDNDDPWVLDPEGFQFSLLDYKIERVVLPLRSRLESKGEKLYVNLTYVDFEKSSFEHYTNAEEYAEFILAVFQHMDSKYGFVPDAVEVILEPDNATGWSASKLAAALVATGRRLERHGYTPDFIAPSTAAMGNAVEYFDEMIRVPNLLNYLSELSYHRYRGVSLGTLGGIARRAREYDLRTSMLEWWSRYNTYETLHEDLKLGNNSAWQPGALAGIGVPDNTTRLLVVDTADPANPRVLFNEGTKFLRQYFKFIRAGARRIEATTTNSEFDPLAFVNLNGGYAVVVKADVSGSFTIKNLPPGVYGLKYTTGTEYDVDLPDAAIAEGQTLTATIPAAGVLTVYAKTGPSSVFLHKVPDWGRACRRAIREEAYCREASFGRGVKEPFVAQPLGKDAPEKTAAMADDARF